LGRASALQRAGEGEDDEREARSSEGSGNCRSQCRGAPGTGFAINHCKVFVKKGLCKGGDGDNNAAEEKIEAPQKKKE